MARTEACEQTELLDSDLPRLVVGAGTKCMRFRAIYSTATPLMLTFAVRRRYS